MRKNNGDFEFVMTPPTMNSLFDDDEHGILSPLSCLREFDSHWILEFDLPLVDKKDIRITFDQNTVSVEARLREKYSKEHLGSIVKFEYFKKSISLPAKINNKKTIVKFQKGRLVIKIPKIVIGHAVKIP
jgi:HSP20 family protein